MSMFRPKTKEEKKEFEVDKIYVAKTEIISSYNNGQGCGPMVVTQYYLVTRCDEDDSIRELFSGVKLEPLRNMQHFDTVYVVETKKLTEYMKNPDKKTLNAELLFDFLVMLNAEEIVRTYTDVEEDEETEEDGEK